MNVCDKKQARGGGADGSLSYPIETTIPDSKQTEALGFSNEYFLVVLISPQGTPTADGTFEISNDKLTWVAPVNYGNIPAQSALIQISINQVLGGYWRINNTFGVPIKVDYWYVKAH